MKAVTIFILVLSCIIPTTARTSPFVEIKVETEIKNTQRQMKKLNEYLRDAENNISVFEEQQTSVSAANVGWHVEHILLVMDEVIASVKASDPSKFKNSIKLSKMVVFTSGDFPRGKVRAPAEVVPKMYNEKSLREHLAATQSRVASLTEVDPNKYFDHFIFGDLKVKKTIKFMGIHTNHHLKIINDILNNTN